MTDAVHAEGGRIFLQLWHVGRLSHPLVQINSERPVAPSAIKADSEFYTPEGLKPYELPRALIFNEIPSVIADFRQGAENAKRAGFDGVKIHGANGYLIDQFLREGTNTRNDAYGGYDAERAGTAISLGDADLVSFGTAFLANPDLVERFKHGRT